jgi:MoaD family protein
MPVTVKIPAALRGYTGRQGELGVEARTVGEAVAGLADSFPDLRTHLLDDEGRLRSFVNVFVGGRSIKGTGGLDTPLSDGDVITLVPAIAGGAAR